ncbi:serine/threonine/tyrosine-interacting-like protein 2 isoform X2 [Spea bombifrons]|uniref:serine/threonine/tyrosine-interacting-like protein 2 isoform X2 n=1 Tax=Spea bombifrons TaxID=233779 RepID=UPI00234BAC20|nr:serine/threonine/tyrosine-interacting-like protein 2 isoform X2 [Spea bombifrons]
MATSQDRGSEQVVPDKGEDDDVRAVQARYLRSPSPSFSMVSDAYTESIFMEPIHLSSSVAAKQIINEELKHKEVKVDTMCPEMLESAEQLLVEDLYNRVKEKIDDRSLFNTPCVLDLQRELVKDRMEAPINSVDEVWPNIFIAEKSVAVNKGRLKRMGITHVLNAAHGTTVFTGPEFYSGTEIQYMGVEVDDFPDSDISKFFRPAAEFLDEALLTCRGKVLVNSEMGISRSAILVAAYLMIFHHMTISDALMTIRKKRAIYPNDEFIKQLRELNEKLLEEREYSDDDDDNKSQESVVQAKAHSIMVEEEDVESVLGAKVHSITVEEEDTTSLMGSSIMGKSSVVSKQPTLIDEDEEEKLYEEWRRKQGLPPRELPDKEQAMTFPENGEDSVDYTEQMIQNWQRQSAKYQSLGLEDDGESSMGERRYAQSEISDVESVTSQEIRMLKQQLESSRINRTSRGRNDSVSTDSTWDMWNQRLQEIEKEAKDRSDHTSKDKKKDIDEESVFSETGSLFNFCTKNKHKLTPLERWKVKRIQFGYHKKDSEASDNQKKEGSEGQKEDEASKSDIDLTAYQSWKIKQQQKVGNENKEEIVELTKGEDSASIKRKQRRAEILERSKQNLEESQSMCGWETESALSGSIPLSAFFQSAPSASSVNDAASVLSMRSNASRLSQARSAAGQTNSPIPPTQTMPPGTPDAISIASIQNWIASVVSETIAQKQNEILMMSRPSSVLSTAPGDQCQKMDDDRSSLFAAAGGSCLSGSLLQGRDLRSSDSVMSCNTSASANTNLSSAKRKITQTSVPLYSLFQDEVDLKKLNEKESELREELSEKLYQYRKEKVVTDNKRSYMFKKKKAKDVEDVEEQENDVFNSIKSSRDSSKSEVNSSYLSTIRSTTSELEKNVNKWLSGVKKEESRESKSENISERYLRRAEARKELDVQTSSYAAKEHDERSYSSFQSNREKQRSRSTFSTSSEEESYRHRNSNKHQFQHYGEDGQEPHFGDYPRERDNLANGELGNSRRARTYSCENLEDSDNSETSYSAHVRAQIRKSKDESGEMDDDDDDIIAAWRRRQEEKKTRIRRQEDD